MKKKFDIVTVLMIAMLVVSLTLLVKAIHDKVKTEAETVYVVKTDENSHPYAVITDVYYVEQEPPVPLSNEEKHQIASIVAGKAGNKPVSVQLMVANVIRSDLECCYGDLTEAIRRFQLGTYKEPTQEQFDVVDAVFERSELSLDDDVLYMRASGEESSFHDSLVFVCEYFGISFYKEG